MPHRFDGRLRRLEQQAPETAWLYSEGLPRSWAASCLRGSPGTWHLRHLDDDGPPSGLGRLPEEARQYRQSMVLGS